MAFQKGMTPWNKGKKGLQKHTSEFKEKARQRFLENNPMKNPEIAKKMGLTQSGEKNHNWTGDNVSNHALHAWVKKKLGHPKNCYVCNESKGWMDLANVTGIYNRDLINWMPMCRWCHTKFDKRKEKISSKELIDFEKNVVEMYKQGLLRSPVHLSGGDEEQIIKIFNLVEENDIVFSNYRSHYHALLHGINKEWLEQWILNNKSIHVMNKEKEFITSAIVGGTLSVSLGRALSIKLKDESNKVWCFIGDMTATTGIFWECYNYAIKQDLPIVFVIADNGLSTDTPTKEAWGMKKTDKHWFEERPLPKIIYYKYKRVYPHYGVGIWVDFKDEQLKQDGSSF